MSFLAGGGDLIVLHGFAHAPSSSATPGSGVSPDGAVTDAWLLTRAIAPRDHVRVAAVDASGTVLNQYSHRWAVDRTLAPPVPWAVPLAHPDGFRLLAFDLDAKQGEQQAARDATAIADLLSGHGICHVVCRSGPSGGRHVWVAMTQPLTPALVALLARLLAARCPSLDIAPLRNAATGCVRPPGSPHRDGGQSEVLLGDATSLLQPSTTVAQIEALVRELVDAVNTTGPTSDTGSDAIRLDTQGHPYLPGSKRELPTASRAALDTAASDGDASVVLNRVLLGAAASHWHFHDLLELAPTAAGLEHVRTRRTSRGRTPRPARERVETLARQWRYAVRFVSEHPRRTGVDATFDRRAGDLTDLVRALQEQADAAAGRWSRGGGPSDRRVLDCLHRFALTAVETGIEADTRRIALACGIGRETARVALQRLAADGWIQQAHPAAGVHGAVWQIDPQKRLHRDLAHGRSQAATRPEGAGAADRILLLQQLEHRAMLATHDLFTGAHALPLAAGNLYSRLTPVALPRTAGDDQLLERLAQFRLVTLSSIGWVHTDVVERDRAAMQLGVDGRLRGRRERYLAERAAWGWWQAEHAWMCGPRSRADARARPDQVPLWQPAGSTRYPKHPRGPDGRADWTAARAAVRDGVLAPVLTLLAA